MREDPGALIIYPVGVMSRQPDPSRVFNPWDVANAGDVLAAAPEPHVAVVSGLDEPAADAHVEAAQDHDSPGNGGKEDELEWGKVHSD